jgi:hypothetical protein
MKMGFAHGMGLHGLGATLWALVVGMTPIAAQAQTNPVVVELYTSQGCAACPPADALIDHLAGREDVIALALHVDYWDYIGWADDFAQSRFSERQKNYARKAGRVSVYTPQMIVGGVSEVKGSSSMQVMGAIQDHLALATRAPVQVSVTGLGSGAVQVQAQATAPFARMADIQLVRYRDSATVEILAGENEGQRITYRNIVTSWDVIDEWDGATPYARQIAVEGTDPVVVVVQEQGLGQVLGAARAR